MQAYWGRGDNWFHTYGKWGTSEEEQDRRKIFSIERKRKISHSKRVIDF